MRLFGKGSISGVATDCAMATSGIIIQVKARVRADTLPAGRLRPTIGIDKEIGLHHGHAKDARDHQANHKRLPQYAAKGKL
jgi:hypothetical protein